MTPTPEEITRHHDPTPPEGKSPWVAGRGPSTPIEVVEPDPAWPWLFATLEDRIRSALGPVALAIEHVGSTAVPGLPAKPVIDIDLVVADSSARSTTAPSAPQDCCSRAGVPG